MSKFRHRPSHRKQAKPTASWLVLGPTTANAVKYGHQTTHLIPCKPSHHHRRYHEGQHLAVKAFVGGPTECRVDITTADRIPLGDVDYHLARELGYVRLDQFQVTWVEQHDEPWSTRLHDQEPDNVIERFSRKLDRFETRHAHRDIWVIRFTLDRTRPPRLLAAKSDELYVENPAMALRGEMSALYEDEWKQHVQDNLDLEHGQWVALGRMTDLDQRRRPHKHQRKAA